MGIVTRSGNLRDAIQHLSGLADRLEAPLDVLNQLGAALVTELAIRVPNATPYSTGTLKRGLSSFTVQGHHVTVGDPAFFEAWQKDAPEHTIGDFIRYMLENKLGYFSARWGGWKQKHLRAHARERQRRIKEKERERQRTVKARRAEYKRSAKTKKLTVKLPKPKTSPSTRKHWADFGQVLESFYRKQESNSDVERFFTLQRKLARSRVTYAEQMDFAFKTLRATKGLAKTQIEEAERLIRDTFQSNVKREQKRATQNRATTTKNKSYKAYSAKQQAKDKAGSVGGVLSENDTKRQSAINESKSRRKKK